MKVFILSLTIHLLIIFLPWRGSQQVEERVFLKESQDSLRIVLRQSSQINKPKENTLLKKAKKKKVTQKKIVKKSSIEKSKVRASEGEKLKMSYALELRRYIDRRKTYPKLALRMRHSGSLKVGLIIKKDGAFKNIQIVSSAPFDTLNHAAIDLLKRIRKFKPLPEGINKELAMNIPLTYSLVQ